MIFSLVTLWRIQVHVEYPNGQQAAVGKDGTIDFIIMENLFHGCEIQAIYDLKGSERDRYVAQAGKGDGPPVLLDDNLRELSRNSPTLVTPAAYKALQQSLNNDTGKAFFIIIENSLFNISSV